MKSCLHILTFCTVMLTSIGYVTQAQEIGNGFKTFHTFSIDMRLADRLTMGMGQLYATSIEPGNNTLKFVQNLVDLEWRPARKWRLQAYWRPTYFHWSNGTWGWIHITGMRLRYVTRWHKRSLSYSLRAERFSPTLSKYQYRFIGQVRHYLTKYRLPMKSALYVDGKLYYYLNGLPVNYYENGELVIRRSPNDFHRFRVMLGLRAKPSRAMRLNLFAMWNKEFNNPLTNYRDINVPNRTGTSILRDFNNYFVLGTSLSFRMDLRK